MEWTPRLLRMCGPATAVALVAASILASMATAAGPARSRVSITDLPPRTLVGFVTSRRAGCAQGRRVLVFKAAGPRGPRGDERVAVVRARRNPGGYRQWSAKADGTGRYWAKLHGRPGCRIARSKTLRVLPRAGDDFPLCSDPRSAQRSNESVCRFPYRVHLDLAYGDTIGLPCPGYGDHSSGHCHGTTDNMPDDWATGFAPHGHLHWSDGPRGRTMSWDLYASWGYITGTLPGPGSARWSISAAGINDDGRPAPGPRWVSPDLPGKDPGTLGGPLYLDWHNGYWGADAFFWGYLLLAPGR